jgi:hypothetical protein
MKNALRLMLCVVLLLAAGSVWAAAQDTAAPQGNTQSKITYNVTELGIVEVLDAWSGMKIKSGTYPYFSATKESGIIPVHVENYSFAVSFATRSYLKREEGKVYFVSSDFYYEGGPLDVDATLHFPGNLTFVSANVEPATKEKNMLTWKLSGVSHQVLIVEFDQSEPFAPPESPGGPLYQVDPATLPELSADEIPQSPDEALKEFETIIKMLQASDSKIDPDMIRVLRRSLSKFYYLFAVYGLVKDYVPEKPADTASGG